MIEVFVPFVLVLMTWNADDPQGTMQVSQRLHIDLETCQKAGQERQVLVERQGNGGREFAWKCVRHQTQIEKYQPLIEAE